MNSTERNIEGRRLAPVWDLPTRLFHWSAALLVGLSWWSAEQAFDPWHYWAGYAFLFLLLFRLLWGFAGGSTARFSTLLHRPSAVLTYVRSGRWQAAGHNPLGAASVLLLLSVLAVQVVTGLIQLDPEDFVEGPLAPFVSFETAEAAHQLHELNFNILLFLIVLHLLAILIYRAFLHRRLVGPMISGRAELEDGVEPLKPAPRWRAAASVLAALAATGWVIAGAPPFGT